MATHSSTLAWRIPRIEEPGRLQSMGLQRDRQTRRKWLSVHASAHDKDEQSLEKMLIWGMWPGHRGTANSLPPPPSKAAHHPRCALTSVTSSPGQERAQHHQHHWQNYCPGAWGEPKAHHGGEEKAKCRGAEKSQWGLGSPSTHISNTTNLGTHCSVPGLGRLSLGEPIRFILG